MKKLALVLVMFFVFAIVAYSEVSIINRFDFSDLSLEELILLRELLDSEIISHGVMEEDRLPVGIYRVGADIKPGTYEVTVYNNEEITPMLLMYEDESHRKSSSWCTRVNFYNVSESVLVTMEEDLIVEVFGGSVYLTQPKTRSWQ